MPSAKAGKFIHANLEALVQAMQDGNTMESEAVIRNLVPEYDPERDKDKKQELIDLAIKLTKLHEHVKGFKPTELAEGTDIKKARDHYVEHLELQTNLLKKYLDQQIAARMKKIQERYQRAERQFRGMSNEETIEKFNVTAVGINRACANAQSTFTRIQRKFKEDEHNLPSVEDSSFLISASQELEKLDALEEDITGSALFKTLSIQEEESEEWARNIAPRLDRILQKNIKIPDGPLREAKRFLEGFIHGNPSLEERTGVRVMEYAEQLRLERAITVLEEKNTIVATLLFEQIKYANTIENIDEECEHVRSRIDEVIPNLLAELQHPVCQTLNVRSQIVRMHEECKGELERVALKMNADPEQRRLDLAKIHLTLERIRTTTEHIQHLDERIRYLEKGEYEKQMGLTGRGCFDYESGKIYINMAFGQDAASIKEAVEHEKGHAIIHILTQQDESCLFPALLLDHYDELHAASKPGEPSFRDLLLSQAEQWNVIREVSDTEESYTHKLVDELVCQYADSQAGRKASITPDEAKLFAYLDRRETSTDVPVQLNFKLRGKASMTTGAADAPGGTNPAEASPKEAHSERETESEQVGPREEDSRDKIAKLRRTIIRIDDFLKAYPEYQVSLNKPFHDLKEGFDKLDELFKEREDGTSAFKRIYDAVSQDAKVFTDFMSKVDYDKMDLSQAKTHSKKGLKGLLSGIEWMSIYDMMGMFKDMGEDISRMWKRRGEAARARVGKNITSWIPKRVWYLGRLSAEFERRDQASENEEVGVYEKGLEKVDNHTLQHDLLRHSNNRDHVKAIMNILTKRGRMDWDDEHFWDTLQRLSRYSMPKGPCKRDNILRNKYLRKLISDIWNDKDLYDEWKAHNDSGIESGKKHNTPVADDLSNITKGLSNELARLLEAHVQNKEHKATREEEINPHLYEEILHYAMRNGKMTMEEKFFYLIRGTHEGLLSIDRLRAFTGQQGEILNSFPFIDFFDKKNNTASEIKILSDKIKNLDDPWRPDVRTTLLMELEVSRDEAVNMRANKGIKRAENFDHEDIPLLLTQLDFKSVDTVVNFTSGSQWKMSVQAMQNGYVGYNSFFKSFAIMEELRKKGYDVPPLTQADMDKLVTILTAYIFYDNRVAGGLGRTGAQPSLSWNQIENERPVSGGTHYTSEFRDPMNDFALSLAKSLGIQEIGSYKIKKTVVENGEKKEKEEEKHLSIQQFIGKGRNDRVIAQLSDNEKKVFSDQSFAVYEEFSRRMREKLADAGNREKFVRALIHFQNRFIPEDSDLTIEKIIEHKIIPKKGHAEAADHGVASHGGH
jgi:hypothetical protein